MASSIELLVPEMQAKAQQLLANCKSLGYEMRPSETLRTPLEQGKLWRQSRTGAEVAAKIIALRQAGANYLADCIEVAGASDGPHVTNSIPGLSWHQWGEAMDCYWWLNEKAVWDTNLLINGKNGYHVYAQEAIKLGLDAGLLWPHFPDNPHVQLRKIAAPDKIYTLQQIDSEMKKRFNNKVPL